MATICIRETFLYFYFHKTLVENKVMHNFYHAIVYMNVQKNRQKFKLT